MNPNDLDHPKTVTHVSLCAGYGGIDLGLKRVVPHLRTVAFSEIEAFACANLVAKMEAGLLDAAPIWTDVKTFPYADFHGRVDILSGGYPCQPFSAAGKRLGRDDPRHLWPWIADGIRAMQPRLCFFENVEGHISLGLREVVEELAGMGYGATWGIFSAAEVGAPHQRKRVFILAHRKREGLEGFRRLEGRQAEPESGDGGASLWPSRPGQPQFGWEPLRVVGNADCGRLEGAGAEPGRAPDAVGSRGEDGEGNVGNTSESRSSQRRPRQIPESREVKESERSNAGSERQIEPALGGDAYGPAGGLDYAELCLSCDNRTDELRLLGNGVVPATAARAFSVLMEELLNDA